MTSISKAIGTLVGGVVGMLILWGIVPADFMTAHAGIIDSAIVIASSIVGTYFAPPNS